MAAARHSVLRHLQRLRVDQADRVVLFVGHIDGIGLAAFQCAKKRQSAYHAGQLAYLFTNISRHSRLWALIHRTCTAIAAGRSPWCRAAMSDAEIRFAATPTPAPWAPTEGSAGAIASSSSQCELLSLEPGQFEIAAFDVIPDLRIRRSWCVWRLHRRRGSVPRPDSRAASWPLEGFEKPALQLGGAPAFMVRCQLVGVRPWVPATGRAPRCGKRDTRRTRRFRRPRPECRNRRPG